MHGYRTDDSLKEIVLKVYDYIQSAPFPYEWLNEKIEVFNINDKQDFGQTLWGEILLNDLKITINESISQLDYICNRLHFEPQLSKFEEVILSDICIYKDLLNSIYKWDELIYKINKIKHDNWPVNKKVNVDLKELAKKIRDNAKAKIYSRIDKFRAYTSKESNEDIKQMYITLKELEKIVKLFGNSFTRNKKEKNCIDFNDIEHLALKVLLKNENGKLLPTDVAKKYQDKFEEIAIDEYQDSNLVQEYILTTISKQNNIFMVGDVKQSIYKFRQARPELFLEKYNKYSNLDNKHDGRGIKIQLFQNFRSRSNILNLTNLIFNTIMSRKLGDIDYDKNEFLRQDKDYDLPKQSIKNYAGKAEMYVIDLSKNIDEEKDDDTENEDDSQHIEKIEIEAKFVANKIKDLLNSNYFVFDKKLNDYRKATYRDIVILLRATSLKTQIYEKEINNLGIPVFSDVSSEYLNSIEIKTILSVLKILDNPLQDIALVCVLRSYIGGFTDNELVKIRLYDKNSYFYDALKATSENVNGELLRKINRIFELLKKWKEEQEYLSLEELIWNIYIDTGYYNYVEMMPDGNIRIANLKMLLERAKQYEDANFKGLFNFIQYMNKIKSTNGDLEAAKIIGENENVVRIMSIHKSKGLEFPIVFLCDMGKSFNLKDLNNNLLLHYEMGFGPKLIDSKKGIEYNTLAKEAIRIKLRKELLSEEMRVLYVALTRSREKLIITGIDNNFEKSMEKKKIDIDIYKTINDVLLQNYISFLDWIELISVAKGEELDEVLDIYSIHKEQILKEDKKEDFEDIAILDIQNIEDNNIGKLLNWKYDYITSTKIPSKTSVTQIKHNSQKNVLEKQKNIIPIPSFLKETKQLSAGQKGSVMHLLLQKLDLKKSYTRLEIKNKIEELVINNILTKMEAESISIEKVDTFLNSKLVNEIKESKAIYKETPFYMNLTAKEALFENSNENILVQGIIDLFYITNDDKIILVDYKTDYIRQGEEEKLIEKYKPQLELYKKALEEATKKEVYKTYIYSVCLNKEMEVFVK